MKYAFEQTGARVQQLITLVQQIPGDHGATRADTFGEHSHSGASYPSRQTYSQRAHTARAVSETAPIGRRPSDPTPHDRWASASAMQPVPILRKPARRYTRAMSSPPAVRNTRSAPTANPRQANAAAIAAPSPRRRAVGNVAIPAISATSPTRSKVPVATGPLATVCAIAVTRPPRAAHSRSSARSPAHKDPTAASRSAD